MTTNRIADFGEPFQRISVDDAKAKIDQGNVQVIDVRQPKEYQEGHVPGSLLVPLDSVLQRADEISQDKEIIFVCAVGERSAVASEIAAAVGRQKIFNLEGGIGAWIRRGFPLEK